jgi:pilus assembly protein CpaC
MPKSLGMILGAAAGAILLAFGVSALQPAAANDTTGSIRASAQQPGNRFLALGIGRTQVVDLPRDAKDVLVANPAIANAVVRSARRAYLIGVAPGQTNVIFFDAEGRQMASYDIEVGRDATGVREALRRMNPKSNLRVDPVGDSVVLSGEVASSADAQAAADAAARLVGDPAKVVNGLTIKGKEQVLLKVTVAEIQRNVLKQMGIDLNGAVNIGSATIGTGLAGAATNFFLNNPFTVQNQSISSTQVPVTANFGSGNHITMTLKAMEQAGVMRTLAEPSLTAISGESAKFLAGGEFPIPAGQTCDASTGSCQISVQFKQFGVGLEFTPVVIGDGRISLKVGTEVSELSTEGAIRFSAINIPSLRVRRASSTVELPSGGGLVMAGLLQEQTKQNINGVPGLMNVPVLGALFRSRDYQRGQTELMIMVTPYVVKATNPSQIARPDDGFADPADPSTILLGQLNRIYGGPGAVKPQGTFHGSYGFILD